MVRSVFAVSSTKNIASVSCDFFHVISYARLDAWAKRALPCLTNSTLVKDTDTIHIIGWRLPCLGWGAVRSVLYRTIIIVSLPTVFREETNERGTPTRTISSGSKVWCSSQGTQTRIGGVGVMCPTQARQRRRRPSILSFSLMAETRAAASRPSMSPSNTHS